MSFLVVVSFRMELLLPAGLDGDGDKSMGGGTLGGDGLGKCPSGVGVGTGNGLGLGLS